MEELGGLNDFEKQDIKTTPITEDQLRMMRSMTSSYEDLFSKRAIKYRSLGLKEMNLSDEDYGRYILEEYTFLKRPVIIVNDRLFAGNSKKTVEAIKNLLAQ